MNTVKADEEVMDFIAANVRIHAFCDIEGGGGSIDVGDNTPRGTRFTIELPC